MQGRALKLAITDVQIYMIAFAVGLFLGLLFFRMQNDSIYPAMCLYQELRSDKLRRNDIVTANMLKFVAGERFKEFGMFFLTQITAIKRVVAYVFCAVCGFACAVLEGFYVQEYAMKGLLVFFITLMPHYIFYAMAWYSLCSAKLPSKQIGKDAALNIARVLAVTLVFLFVGIICESIFNVWIIKNFLHIFLQDVV